MKNVKMVVTCKSGSVPLGIIAVASIGLVVLGSGVGYKYYTEQESIDNYSATELPLAKNEYNQIAQQNLESAGDLVNYQNNDDAAKAKQLVQNLSVQALNDAEKEDLLFMREEEKLARDVYLALHEKWGEKVFSNIAASEQKHMLAIKALLDKYSLRDSVIADTRGVFANQDLKALYDKLVKDGSVSLVAAMQVGMTVEDLDIRDLQNAIARTDNEDIKVVYENLMRGSRNHMRAFDKNLKKLGGSYEVQYITKKEYNDIVGSQTERGQGGNKHGQDNKMKQGQGQGQGGGYGRGMQ